MQGDRLASKDPFTPGDGAPSSIISQNCLGGAAITCGTACRAHPPQVSGVRTGWEAGVCYGLAGAPHEL